MQDPAPLEPSAPEPIVLAPRPVAADTLSLTAWMPLPELGLLAGNAFVLRAAQPMLVDTGVAGLRDPFMAALRQAIDPAELRWIWLSHTDADHIGNLTAVLEAAPQARVVTNFLGMAKMGLLGLPLDRVHLLQPDERLDLGDRQLTPLRPPYYDAPESTGFFEPSRRLLFCVDSFGALLPQPAESAAAIETETLRAGMSGWSTIDAPWLDMADRAAFAQALDNVQRLDPAAMISGHLPVASGRETIARLVQIMTAAYCAHPAAAPDTATVAKLAA